MNGTIYTNSVKIKIILLQKPKTTSLNQEAAKYRIVPSLKKKKWNGTVASIGFAESFSETPLSQPTLRECNNKGGFFLLSAKVYRIAGSRIERRGPPLSIVKRIVSKT